MICKSYLYIWRFPELGVPPNHPFIDGIFHEINRPFGGTTIDGNPHMSMHQFMTSGTPDSVLLRGSCSSGSGFICLWHPGSRFRGGF